MLESIRLEVDSQQGVRELLPTLGEVLHRLRERNAGHYAGLGLGFCGLVDSSARRVLATNGKFSDATDIDFPGWAASALGLPLVLENDARMALLGEWQAGSAENSGDVVMMTLGTGIGTAVLCGGRLLRGRHFQAGCLGGHFTVALNGRRCSCGAQGCFEAEASTYALRNIAREWPGFTLSRLAEQMSLDFETVFDCAERGDSVAIEIRDHCVGIWAACALSLVHAYDPELMVIGGGVLQNSYPLVKQLEDHVHAQAWTPWGKVEFRAASLGSDAALLGAWPLLRQQHAI